MKKILIFLVRNIKNPKFLFHYILNYKNPEYKVSAHFISDEDVVRSIGDGKSLIRIGDGEIGLINGKGISGTVFLQEPSPLLSHGFKKMIKEYSGTSPYILAIPKKYLSWSNKELRKENKLRAWLPLKVMYNLIFPKSIAYADAHMFYYPKFFETKLAPMLTGRQIILVMNEHKINALGDTSTWGLKVHFVPTLPSHATREYLSIKERISKLSQEYEKENPLLVTSCGPVGKVLVYEFSKIGLQGIDLGEGANVLFQDTRIDHLI